MSDKNNGKELSLPGQLHYHPLSGFVFDVESLPWLDLHSNDGPRVRGWGWLTGGGGLYLSFEEAAAYQDRIGARMVAAWNAYHELDALRELREIAGMYCEQLPQEVRDALHRIPGIEKTHSCTQQEKANFP